MLLVTLGCGPIVDIHYGGGELVIWPRGTWGSGEVVVPGLTQAQLENDEEPPESYAWVGGMPDTGWTVHAVLERDELQPWLDCSDRAELELRVNDTTMVLDGDLWYEGDIGSVRGWNGDPDIDGDATMLDGTSKATLPMDIDFLDTCPDALQESELQLTLAWAFDEDVMLQRRDTPAWAPEVGIEGLAFSWQ